MTANMKRIAKDDRVPAVAVVVKPPSDGGNHWDFVGNELMLHVITKSRHTPMWVHVGGGFRSGRGVWAIPDVGTEGIVAFDDGEFEGDGFLVGTFGRGPTSLGMNTTIVIDDHVEIRSKNGSAVALATKDELDDLVSTFNNHTHVLTLTAGTGTAAVPAPPASTPTGTTVLKAE